MATPHGPKALPPEPPEDESKSTRRALSRLEQHRDAAPGASFHTMAEALRANAEALHQIDTSQKRMAESLRRHDRVSDVVTSTKALNETFRGLNEIQRGLLDALVRERGRSAGGGPWALLSLVLLVALLGILGWAQVTEDDRVPRDLYEDARREANQMSGTASSLRESKRDLQTRLGQSDQQLDELRDKDGLNAAEVIRLTAELERNQAQVDQYLKVKERADAGALLAFDYKRQQNENEDLRRQLARVKEENGRLWDKLRRGIEEGRLGDPEAIIKRAKALKVIPEETGPGPVRARTPRELTRIRRRLKRLLEGAAGTDGYELLKLADVNAGASLVDVEVGRYEKNRAVSTIYAASLVIRVDKKNDGVELRFRDGYMVNHSHPNEKIMLDPVEGHSVFLKQVSAESWLEDVADSVTLSKTGELSWN